MGNSYYGGSGDLAMTLSADIPTTYGIAATSSSVLGGSVAGAGTFALDAVVNLSATPKTGYSFVNWTENGVIVSSSALLSFSANADRTLVANFLPSWQLTLSSPSTTMGTVAGGGTYITGSSVSATATAKPGYVFLHWKEGASIVCTTPVYNFTMIAPRTLMAHFAVGFTVAEGSSFLPGGSVSGTGGYATGSNVSLSASALPGYRFTGWTENGSIVSQNTIYSFSASANRTLVANFVPIVGIRSSAPGSLDLTWPSSATGWGLEECTDLSTWIPSQPLFPPPPVRSPARSRAFTYCLPALFSRLLRHAFGAGAFYHEFEIGHFLVGT